ncbi:MAG: NUMOD4 motif-containing HNH endonuclease [Planctomycetota bacterium]
MAKTIDNEVWKPVPGYEQAYDVSDLGRVRSLDRFVNGRWGTQRVHGRLLKQPRGQAGYPEVCLHDGAGGQRRHSVHQLVLAAFVGPMPPEHVCRHLDGSRDNNRLSNLAYGTQADNANDRESHGRTCRGEQHSSAKLNHRAVRFIRSSTARSVDLAKAFNVSDVAISAVRSGRTWKHVA